MSRLNFFLLLLLVICAVLLVNAQYQARDTFIELNRAQNLMHELLQLQNRWEYEKSVLSKSARIEMIAKDKLQMEYPTLARTQYFVFPKKMVAKEHDE